MPFLYPLLATIELINFLTFGFYAMGRQGGCDLQVWRKTRSSKKMTYFLAGIKDQPQPVYRFIKNDITGGITYVNYKNTGWSPKCIAMQIANDIAKNGYQDVTIYAISISDKVARYAELFTSDIVNLKIVAINPCNRPQMLKPFWRVVITIASILLLVLSLLLGWLSILPVIPANNGRYSLKLLADQLREMAFEDNPYYAMRTIGVICSEHDQYLDTTETRSYFQDLSSAEIVTLNTKHAYTVREPQLYQEAVRQILHQAVL